MRRVIQRFNPFKWTYVAGHLAAAVIGVLLIVLGENETVKGIGISMVAAASAGLLVYTYAMLAHTKSEQLSILTDFGLIRAFSVRSIRIREEYESRLRNPKHNVDIMGFGLSSLRKDFGDETDGFRQWAKQAKVRILLIDPRFPTSDASFASQRDREERQTEGSIAGDVHRFIMSTRSLIEDKKLKNFRVKLYTALPSLNIFRIDDELFWGPYLMGEQSWNSPTFLVKRPGTLFGRLTEHFDKIWDDPLLSRDIPAEWLKQNQIA